jgi:hypothetical protein
VRKEKFLFIKMKHCTCHCYSKFSVEDNYLVLQNTQGYQYKIKIYDVINNNIYFRPEFKILEQNNLNNEINYIALKIGEYHYKIPINKKLKSAIPRILNTNNIYPQQTITTGKYKIILGQQNQFYQMERIGNDLYPAVPPSYALPPIIIRENLAEQDIPEGLRCKLQPVSGPSSAGLVPLMYNYNTRAFLLVDNTQFKVTQSRLNIYLNFLGLNIINVCNITVRPTLYTSKTDELEKIGDHNLRPGNSVTIGPIPLPYPIYNGECLSFFLTGSYTYGPKCENLSHYLPRSIGYRMELEYQLEQL